jgi:D-amino-acid dehydrogenase
LSTRAGHTVVIGGGVAGLCTAYFLRRHGVEVTLVEAARIGAPIASSYGNGGWICPAQAGPLPEPGLTIHGFRALLNRDSSLYFNPSYLPRLLPWLLRFWTYSNQRDFENGTRALAALGRRVFELVDELVDSGLAFELHKLGMIVVGTNHESVAKMHSKLAPMRSYGYKIPEALLGADELHALEPALAPRVRAGLFVEEQWHVRADTFTTSLGRALADRGVRIVEGTAVTGFAGNGRRVRLATTDTGVIEGDTFVLCAGSWTRPLAAKLGSRIPLEAGKGYTFMIDAHPTPRHGLLFPEVHAGATPLADGVRMGGTMEFSGCDTGVDERRINAVFGEVREFLNVTNPAPREAWAGLRPMTADGLPIIDRLTRCDNAYIATGYSMLGMTLSPPAGEALAEMIVTGRRPDVLEPFRVDRFPRFILRRRGSSPAPSS